MTPQLKSYTTNAAITIMQHLESYTVVAEQILFFFLNGLLILLLRQIVTI